MKFLRKITPSAPIAAAIAAVILMSVTLLVTPLIGLADSGDFFRVTNGRGIYKLDRYENDQYYNYFSSKYGLYQYFNEYEKGLFSTQTPLIEAGKTLNKIFNPGDIFDIRFISVILIIYCAAAIYLITDYATYNMGKSAGAYLIAAVAVIMFADTGYTAYFNSFYAEGLVFVSFIMSIACALLISQRRYSAYALMLMLALNGFILTGAKQQNAPVGILLGLLCIALAFAGKKVASDADSRLTGYVSKHFKLLAVFCAAILFAVGAGVYLFIPTEFVNINQYHAMTKGVLMTSRDPEKTLEAFNIDPQLALLNNSNYYERFPAFDVEGELLKNEFYNKYGFVPVAMYYLQNPDQLYLMLDKTAKVAYSIRPEYLGNYERSSGRPPMATTSFFTLHSKLKYRVAPQTFGFVILWSSAALVISFRDRKRTWVIAATILVGLSQIAVSIIGAGEADISKHVFLYNVAFDLVNFVGASLAIAAPDKNLNARREQKAKAEAAALARANPPPQEMGKSLETGIKL